MNATLSGSAEPRTLKCGRHPLHAGTRLGRVAGWLAVVFLVWYAFVSPIMIALFGRSTVVPPTYVLVPMILLGWIGLASAVAGGIVGLVAITRRHDHGLFVYATLVPGLVAAAFVLGELLLPH